MNQRPQELQLGRGPDLGPARAQRHEQRAERDDSLLGRRPLLHEGGKLGDTAVARLGGQPREHLGDPPLDAPALGLERKRLCIAGGERVVDAIQEWACLHRFRGGEKIADFVGHHSRRCDGCRRLRALTRCIGQVSAPRQLCGRSRTMNRGHAAHLAKAQDPSLDAI